MSLLRQGKAQVLTIYLGESDQWHGEPLYVAIVQYLRESGCAGATVTRAVAGYGAGARLHAEGGWRLSSDAPLIIQVIDSPARLQRLLPHLQEMLSGGLMTLHEIEVLKYTHARRQGLPTKLPVKQVMETSIETVLSSTPVAHVIDLLLEAPFRLLPVVDIQGHLQGVISTGDLINAGIFPLRRGLLRTLRELDQQAAQSLETPLAQARQSNLTAQEVMNRQVRSTRPEQTIRDAARVMLETGLRRLPVIEADGRLVGMLSRADLLQVVVTSPLMSPNVSSATQPLRRSGPLNAEAAQQQPVTDFLNPDVATVSTQTPLTEVIDTLILSPLKRVLVVNDSRQVLGIISDVDVLTRVQERERGGLLSLLMNKARGRPGKLPTGALRPVTGKTPVAGDIMNSTVVTIGATSTVAQAIEQMLATGRKVLPVVDTEGRLLGTVGRSDLLHVFLEG